MAVADMSDGQRKFLVYGQAGTLISTALARRIYFISPLYPSSQLCRCTICLYTILRHLLPNTLLSSWRYDSYRITTLVPSCQPILTRALRL